MFSMQIKANMSHVPRLHKIDNNDVINIQLPYDLNSPTKPDLWSSSFHPISLHGSIKQITSDSKSIRDSLNFIARYIITRRSNLQTLMTYWTLMVWEILSGISFHQYTNPTGTRFILTINPQHLGQRSCLSSLQESH